MKTTTETITPALAEKWLNSNTGNRTMRPGVAERYAKDMRAGRWTECTDPIVFYEDGVLADGQHRLWAIVDSSTTQTFLVIRGFSREAGLNLNVGLPRNTIDNAHLSGYKHTVTYTLLAITKAIYTGERSTRAGMSNAEKLDILEMFREPAEWALSNGPKKKPFRNSVVYAAVARAYLAGVDRDKLKRFCSILGNGLAQTPNESAAVCARNAIIAAGHGGSISTDGWRNTFFLVQHAIRRFMSGAVVTRLSVPPEEPYPLSTGRPLRTAAKSALLNKAARESRVRRTGAAA